jgi:hypothetical protein
MVRVRGHRDRASNNQELLAGLIGREVALMPAEIADRVSPLIDSVVANPFGVGITGC